MEVGEKLKDLNMTVEEIDKLTKAFKDETFRGMLRDYAQELSNPENKKRYEEEIKIMEKERGHDIEFIHPEPFRSFRTSVNSSQKCFINICSNEKVGKPSSAHVESEGGRLWTLPHFLHSGRPEIDTKGSNVIIYDVIFHPDTLHMAGKNVKFMDMVVSTAFQGIQNNFHVTLDENNAREMKTKYKGPLQPCIIRKPLPGYEKKKLSKKTDPLAFPYPDENQTATVLKTSPTNSPATKSSDAQTQKHTKPNHTVKYRSVIDVQDFSCSRDSIKSSRPKEIVVTIDLPLLKAARDANLEVKERLLLLESKKPAYRLELALAYPVDEAKGEAKFNKQRGQLTVTLPVLPSHEVLDFGIGLAKTTTSDDDRQEKREAVEEREMEQRGDDDEEKVKDEGPSEERQRQEKGQERMSQANNREEKQDIDLEEAVNGNQIQEAQEKVEEEKVKEVGNLNTQTQQHLEDLHEERRDEFRNEAAFLHDAPCKVVSDKPVDTQSLNIKDCSVSKGNNSTSTMLETDEANKSTGLDSGDVLRFEEVAKGSENQEGRRNLNDTSTIRIFQNPEPENNPPAVLREIDKQGNEVVISDHSTAAGFTFQNSLMFELD